MFWDVLVQFFVAFLIIKNQVHTISGSTGSFGNVIQLVLSLSFCHLLTTKLGHALTHLTPSPFPNPQLICGACY